MECRTSLFLPKQQPAVPSGAGSSLLPPPSPVSARQIRSTSSHLSRYNNNRNHHQHHQASPQSGFIGAGVAAVEIPLPLPKNQVMMALMELSSFTSKDQKETNLVDESDSASSDMYEDEDALVFDGIESLAGQCGTYVVRDRNGLVVQLQHPSKTGNNNESTEEEEYDDLMLKMTDSSASFLTAKSNAADLEDITVGYGQKVQVVDCVDGVFRLPRNRGFIAANNSQLVKVGAPLEQCCKIEGMLSSLLESKLDLQNKLEQLSKAELNLSHQLTKERSIPEIHPIITESFSDYAHRCNNISYQNPYEDDRNDFDMTTSGRLSPSPTQNTHSSCESETISPTPISPPSNRTSIIPTTKSEMFQLSDDDDDHIDNGMDWRLQAISVVEALPDPINGNDNVSQPLSPFRRGLICGSSLFPRLGLRSALSGESADSVYSGSAISAGVGEENSGDRGIELSYSVPAPNRNWTNRSWTGGLHGTNENDGAGANTVLSNTSTLNTALSNISALNTVPSNTSVDFRTGMSGHMGLGSAVKDGRRSQLGVSRGEMRMMSEHRGIGAIRPIRKLGSPRQDIKKK